MNIIAVLPRQLAKTHGIKGSYPTTRLSDWNQVSVAHFTEKIKGLTVVIRERKDRTPEWLHKILTKAFGEEYIDHFSYRIYLVLYDNDGTYMKATTSTMDGLFNRCDKATYPLL